MELATRLMIGETRTKNKMPLSTERAITKRSGKVELMPWSSLTGSLEVDGIYEFMIAQIKRNCVRISESYRELRVGVFLEELLGVGMIELR